MAEQPDPPVLSDHAPVHLKRALGLPGLTLFGLVYLVPLTVFTTYGIVTDLTGGRLALAYVFTLAAMIFTALSYGWMVRAFPVSGSAYTYTQKSFGGHAGFLTGWSLMLDYLFLPMINYLVIGIFLNAQFPSVPGWVWALAAIVLVTVLNVVGITTHPPGEHHHHRRAGGVRRRVHHPGGQDGSRRRRLRLDAVHR